MLKSPLFIKILVLIGSVILLLLPLSMLKGLINERSQYRDDVENSLEQSTSGPQKLLGPLIALPITEMISVQEGGKEVMKPSSFIHYYLPDELVIEGDQKAETRHIGIYDGQIWNAALNVRAVFNTDKFNQWRKPGFEIGQPFIALAVGDSRGIVKVDKVNVNNYALPAIEPGTGLASLKQGVHVDIPDSLNQEPRLNLTFSLNLMGTGTFSVVPLGRMSQLSLTSNWPHPGFLGDFLPQQREVGDSGFKAQWQSSWFANNINTTFEEGADLYREINSLPAFSVTVETPADQYQLIDRAVKYALLLIALTFMAFFIFETLTSTLMHPMQYLLVGMSLVMFYLVLLALSEHIGFNLAWLSASLVCALINGIYLQAVMKGWKRSLVFSAGLLTLDAVLWQLLRSQESALLLGTAVLLVVLTTVMFLTRHIDWYALSKRAPRLKPQVAQGDERERLWK
ncbi:cell envelope integrity protein CreD [Atlantibacter sp. RC6]|uniref:cell envelope integrity protein CreD n=1 Tax=Atlantibacter sp. RC6 TaxID=2587036 RepID=UPI001605A232|nr:cell envelope integrity protein CreD [Atlantibacter sp. RC6]MBB3322556.1 inner membrane protein [Atlantibacter sp. RC6]